MFAILGTELCLPATLESLTQPFASLSLHLEVLYDNHDFTHK